MLSVPLGDNKIHYLEAFALLVTVGAEENRGPLELADFPAVFF